MGKKSFTDMPKIYILFVTICAFFLLYNSLGSFNSNKILVIVFWIFLTVIAEYKVITIDGEDGTNAITLSFAAHLSAIMVLGVGTSMWIAVLSTLIVDTIDKKPWYKKLFNTGQYAITTFVSGHVYYLLKFSDGASTINALVDLPAVLVSSSAYILLNTLLVSIIIFLTSEDRFRDIFFSDFRVIISYFYSLMPMSIAIAYLYDRKYPFVVLIMVPPLLLMEQAVRRYYSLHSESKATLEVLAKIIDKRDKYTYDHSSRVSTYARQIAEKLGLPSSKIKEIETAGLVHDLGKVAIEDSIIRKRDTLTEDEFNIIKKHPEISHNLLKNIQPYRNAAEYVLHHHERYDGSGYPGNLSGEDIPLESRILAVADSYDAMTSNRSYRTSIGQIKAVKELADKSGTQFDRKVVQAFIEVLKSEYNLTEEDEICS